MSPQVPELDVSLYKLQGDELEFFKAQTGIYDEEELKSHILAVQAEAYAVDPYPCIRIFSFTTWRLSKFPGYDSVLKIGRERPDGILLDLACCFGNEARKVIADGYPLKNVIASDIQPEFWNLGHKLFNSSQETFPVPFLPGNVFDPTFLEPNAPLPSSSTPPFPAPPLSSVRSLTQLQYHISVIHASSLFHLFPKELQYTLVRLLSSLLSPLPGSIILGSHLGVSEGGQDVEDHERSNGFVAYGNSPASWERMWVGDDGVFNPRDVVLSTKSVELEQKLFIESGGDRSFIASLLVWSVTRA